VYFIYGVETGRYGLFLFSCDVAEGGDFLRGGEAACGFGDFGVFVSGDGVWVVCADVEEDSFAVVWGECAVVAEKR
jgi:hypothetical protein